MKNTLSEEGLAYAAKALGISKKQLLANWDRDAAEQRAAEKPLKSLQAMAKRRGCELHCLHDDTLPNGGYDDETGDAIIVYWLFVPMPSGGVYPDQVVFDDVDEIEFDLNSRPVVRAQ
jgi:hypothetical protein